MANLNVEGLKEIYVALGGSADDVAGISTIPEMLTAIAPYAQASAAELPAVTGADDGDVLTVVSGKWKKAAPAGGASITIIPITITENVVSLPEGTTVSDLAERYNNGENIAFISSGGAVYNIKSVGTVLGIYNIDPTIAIPYQQPAYISKLTYRCCDLSKSTNTGTLYSVDFFTNA